MAKTTTTTTVKRTGVKRRRNPPRKVARRTIVRTIRRSRTGRGTNRIYSGVNQPVKQTRNQSLGKDRLRLQGCDLILNEQVASNKSYTEGEKILDVNLDPMIIPRLAAIGGTFQRARFHSYRVHVMPQFTTAATGGYIAALIKDPDDATPTGAGAVNALTSNKPNKIGKFYQPTTLVYQTKKGDVPLYISGDQTSENRWRFPAKLVILATGGGPSIAGSFMVKVEWDVEFLDPTMVNNTTNDTTAVVSFPQSLHFKGGVDIDPNNHIDDYAHLVLENEMPAITSLPVGSVLPLPRPYTFMATLTDSSVQRPVTCNAVRVRFLANVGNFFVAVVPDDDGTWLELCCNTAVYSTINAPIDNIPANYIFTVYPSGTVFVPETKQIIRNGHIHQIPTGKYEFRPPTHPADNPTVQLSGERYAASMTDMLRRLRV